MNDVQLVTLEQLRGFLAGAVDLRLTPTADAVARYGHIKSVLKRFKYPQQSKAHRGLIRRYLRRVTAQPVDRAVPAQRTPGAALPSHHDVLCAQVHPRRHRARRARQPCSARSPAQPPGAWHRGDRCRPPRAASSRGSPVLLSWRIVLLYSPVFAWRVRLASTRRRPPRTHRGSKAPVGQLPVRLRLPWDGCPGKRR
jgi:hypothetical protein